VNKEIEERTKQFKRTFDTIDGKAVLEYLEKKYYHQRTYSKGDAYHTAFREGQRDVISKIRKTVLEELK